MKRDMLVPIVTVTVIMMRDSCQKVQSPKEKKELHTTDQTKLMNPGVKHRDQDRVPFHDAVG